MISSGRVTNQTATGADPPTRPFVTCAPADWTVLFCGKRPEGPSGSERIELGDALMSRLRLGALGSEIDLTSESFPVLSTRAATLDAIQICTGRYLTPVRYKFRFQRLTPAIDLLLLMARLTDSD
jgi:hypothetical protein